MMVKGKFYQRLKQARELLGLTQANMVRELGVSLTSYRNWEYGGSTPNPTNMQKIINFFNAHSINITE